MRKKSNVNKKKHPIRHLFILILVIVTVCVAIKAVPFVQSGYQMYQKAVSEKSLEEAIAEVRADDTYLTLDEIPKSYRDKLIDSEDRRFYKHAGLDMYATMRAVVVNLKAGTFKEGGSTITQQLAKNLYFSFDKKIERKVAELLVAIELEKLLTKDEILELYCNIAYFGEGCYGLKEAANYYYGVEADALTENQESALVFTIKSPNNYNPNVYEGDII